MTCSECAHRREERDWWARNFWWIQRALAATFLVIGAPILLPVAMYQGAVWARDLITRRWAGW